MHDGADSEDLAGLIEGLCELVAATGGTFRWEDPTWDPSPAERAAADQTEAAAWEALRGTPTPRPRDA